MKLQEKFKQWLDTDPRAQIREVQLEVIADDFAIDFAMFIKKEYGYIFMTRNNYKEALSVYKKQKKL